MVGPLTRKEASKNFSNYVFRNMDPWTQGTMRFGDPGLVPLYTSLVRSACGFCGFGKALFMISERIHEASERIHGNERCECCS